MAAAEERRRADMGYDGPSDYSSTLARISAWRSAAGMQIYPENAPDTLLLGGEVLVSLLPNPTVHASYAGSAAEGHHCPAIDAYFSRLVSDVTKGGRLREVLEYMTHLDKLAKCEGNAAAFVEVQRSPKSSRGSLRRSLYLHSVSLFTSPLIASLLPSGIPFLGVYLGRRWKVWCIMMHITDYTSLLPVCPHSNPSLINPTKQVLSVS